jgi:hypothetical protein
VYRTVTHRFFLFVFQQRGATIRLRAGFGAIQYSLKVQQFDAQCLGNGSPNLTARLRYLRVSLRLADSEMPILPTALRVYGSARVGLSP